MRTKTLSFILMMSAILFLVNDFAIKANLYWTTSWADIATHTMGGIVVSGIIVFLATFKGGVTLNTTLLMTIFIGILWEVFELYNGLTIITDKGYALDTFGDIFFDIFGAYLGYGFLKK